MKELFIALSQYNQKTNLIIYSHIEKMNKSELGKVSKAYFPSVAHNVIHLLTSDIKWLGRLSQFHQSKINLSHLEAFLNDEGDVDCEKTHKNMKLLLNLRYDVDLIIGEIINSIPSEEYKKFIVMPFGKKTIEKELWKLLLQWFNHQTHHRGQLSVQLDLLGINNDYSLVLDKIE